MATTHSEKKTKGRWIPILKRPKKKTSQTGSQSDAAHSPETEASLTGFPHASTPAASTSVSVVAEGILCATKTGQCIFELTEDPKEETQPVEITEDEADHGYSTIAEPSQKSDQNLSPPVPPKNLEELYAKPQKQKPSVSWNKEIPGEPGLASHQEITTSQVDALQSLKCIKTQESAFIPSCSVLPANLLLPQVSLPSCTSRGIISSASSSELASDLANQLVIFQQENKELQDEVVALQNCVYRLNSELGHYQFANIQPSKFSALPLEESCPPWLTDMKQLSPLLLAYDTQLEEREKVIQENEETLVELRQEVKRCVTENRELHNNLEIFESRWSWLQNCEKELEDAKQAMEENFILKEKIILLENRQSQSQHKAEMEEMKYQISRLQQQKVQLESNLKQYQTDYKILKDHQAILLEENRKNVPHKDHVEAMLETRRLLNELKRKHEDQVEKLEEQLQESHRQRSVLSIENVQLEENSQQINADNKALKEEYKQVLKQCHTLEMQLEKTHLEKNDNRKLMNKLLFLAERIAQERDILARKSEEMAANQEQLMNWVKSRNMMDDKLQDQLKVFKVKALNQIEKTIKRMHKTDETWKGLCQGYEQELAQLHKVINNQEKEVVGVKNEKRFLEEDLETLWQTVMRENHSLKTYMYSSLSPSATHKFLMKFDKS
ncbi:centrosomal protein of 89 kDa-like isoform X2 [Limulus polyphemus]|nr:centrosomal protein of 89 kDa-like isoform X2 [Limulus polyphemus]XP_022252753.1 centrosomal protein of 89 kDa-like isoform X2 [Limulus polyphemus]XP_022252754.1 centrosomal protein of 89 kDa-like isoform X2 [Limulus polyphemus]